MIGPNEWLLIIVVLLVLFGASAIPKFARSLGKAKSEFEKGLKEGEAEGKQDAKEGEEAKPAGK
jgi:sec-independent protein translocase protein TatA